MKIRLLSDLHLELGKCKIEPMDDDADTILVLAGDLGEKGYPRNYVEQVVKQFRFVIYILGNHEHHHGEYYAVIEYWKQREAEIPNLVVLHNECCVVDGVRFLGTTLWTDINRGNPIDMLRAQGGMKDYRAITIIDETCDTVNKHTGKIVGRSLIPEDTVKFHLEAITFLKNELNKDFDGKTVVITHHSPSHSLVEDMFKNSKVTSSFHANCDDMFYDFKIDYWLYGHTHCATHSMINETEVHSNPRGYVGIEDQTLIGFVNTFFIDTGG